MKEIASFIRENDDFLIAAHINPDGDALGSAIALLMALEQMGKKGAIYDKDPVPDFYRFLPGSERVAGVLAGTDGLSLILIDCNVPKRAELEGRKFKNSAVIDHHATEGEFGGVRWIDAGSAATGLMVYRLIRAMGLNVTKDIAINLYCAIAADTGLFRFHNTGPEALRAAAELAEAGAEPGYMAEALYADWSRARFKLLCMTLGGLEITDGVAVSVVTNEMFRASGARPEDTENFSSFPRMISDVRISAIFRETDEGWKASLRSKGQVDVAKIAESFGGGGHRNAAGFTIKADLETAKRKFLDAVKIL